MAKAYLNLNEVVFAPLSKDPRFTDYTGDTFGRLVVAGYLGKQRWCCRCNCGNVISVYVGNLVSGRTPSCGCQHLENLQARATHRRSKSKEYASFNSAKTRCRNPKCEKYPDYGGRGIKFLFKSFEEFHAEVGDRPDDDAYSLGRKDNNGHYEPGNVQWETAITQGNNRRSSHWVTIGNETKTVAQWALYGVGRRTILYRLSKGWCPSCAVYKPVTGSTAKYVCPHK